MTERGMQNRSWEEKLKELFAQLRDEEERAAPAFQDVLSRGGRSAGGEQPAAARKLLAGAAAALVLLALGIAHFAVRSQHDPAPLADQPPKPLCSSGEVMRIPWQSTVLLTDWQSPTSFLLHPEDIEDPDGVVWEPLRPEGTPL